MKKNKVKLVDKQYYWEPAWKPLSKADWLDFIEVQTKIYGYYCVNCKYRPQFHQVPELRRLIKEGKVTRERIGKRTILMVL